MGTSPRTGLVTQPTQPEFLNHSQLVLYLLLFISYRLFFTGHWHPETLEPRASVCLSRSTPRLISTFSQSRDVVSFHVHTAATSTLLTRRGSVCDINASHTQGCVCVINASLTISRHLHITGFPRSDRGHHVPALTVTSGERGVGFDMLAWGRLVVLRRQVVFVALASQCSIDSSVRGPDPPR